MIKYPNLPAAGSRVQLVWFGPCECPSPLHDGFGPCECPSPLHDDNERVPSGTQGTVISVDDANTIHVQWDNGPNLGLIPGYDIYSEVG